MSMTNIALSTADAKYMEENFTELKVQPPHLHPPTHLSHTMGCCRLIIINHHLLLALLNYVLNRLILVIYAFLCFLYVIFIGIITSTTSIMCIVIVLVVVVVVIIR